MGLLAHQSPFSILGLRYGEYSRREISRAFKDASLHCHPDKLQQLPNPVIPTGYFTLIQEAAECLKGVPTQQFKEFKGYPILFFPRVDNIRQSDVYRIPRSTRFSVCEHGEVLPQPSSLSCGEPDCKNSIFRVCHACKTPIPLTKYDENLSAHTDLCRLCGEVTAKGHYNAKHPDTICPLCGIVEVSDMHSHVKSHAIKRCAKCQSSTTQGALVNHITGDHFDCPLCGRKCGSDFGDYLIEIHDLRPDIDCDGCFNGDLSHYQKSHQWILCPRCELHIAKGELWRHLEAKLGFERHSLDPALLEVTCKDEALDGSKDIPLLIP
ncbi:hypothetical protein QBC46DRAFT_265732 [Diplogelasinospora grovesii]|uniref:J domain-containing protein n=1 Tax=Diplogelasinospora grovesii TaxID=303347 RepID=A0AAN6N486_9PEZI|nr:hypothetical protein QBC46DRAFT_265732 [Diplogelasinospora grovesii]